MHPFQDIYVTKRINVFALTLYRINQPPKYQGRIKSFLELIGIDWNYPNGSINIIWISTRQEISGQSQILCIISGELWLP